MYSNAILFIPKANPDFNYSKSLLGVEIERIPVQVKVIENIFLIALVLQNSAGEGAILLYGFVQNLCLITV